MMPFFTTSQAVVQQLLQPAEPEQGISLARAVWRALQLLPVLHTSWSAAPLYSVILHKVLAGSQISLITTVTCSV